MISEGGILCKSVSQCHLSSCSKVVHATNLATPFSKICCQRFFIQARRLNLANHCLLDNPLLRSHRHSKECPQADKLSVEEPILPGENVSCCTNAPPSCCRIKLPGVLSFEAWHPSASFLSWGLGGALATLLWLTGGPAKVKQIITAKRFESMSFGTNKFLLMPL